MKVLKGLLVLIFFIGFGLLVAAFTMGLDIDAVTNYFVEDDAYGDEIVYDSTETIDTLVVNVDTRHLMIEKHTGDHIRIRYHAHEEKDTWTVTEENGTLTIEQDERMQWFNLWTKYATRSIKTVYISIPEVLVLTYDIDTETGDVNIEDLGLNSLDISLATGNISLVNLNIDHDLIVESSTGNITLSAVTADVVTLKTNTGKIMIDDLDAASLDVDSDTGRIIVETTTIQGEITIESSTGSIAIESTVADGFDISSSTGDVTITVTSLSDYRYDLKTDVGVVKVGGINQGTTHVTATGLIFMKVRVSTGSITIEA